MFDDIMASHLTDDDDEIQDDMGNFCFLHVT